MSDDVESAAESNGKRVALSMVEADCSLHGEQEDRGNLPEGLDDFSAEEVCV